MSDYRWSASGKPGQEFLVKGGHTRMGYILPTADGFEAFFNSQIGIGYLKVHGTFASARDAKIAVIVKMGLDPQEVADEVHTC